jgi:hypothetical protein
MNKCFVTEILTKHGFKYIYDNTYSKMSIPVGIGDILFKLCFIQQNQIPKPIYINLDIFITGIVEIDNKPILWFNDPINMFIFRVKLLNDICENNQNIKKEDIIFFSTKYKMASFENVDYFNYRALNFFKLNVNPFFFEYIFDDKIMNFIKNSFIIIHTKLRLNNKYNYSLIKYNLNNFFKQLKINNFNIIIMGEQKFENKTPEKIMHNITTIYDEISELKTLNSSKILDLTVKEIYDSLDYNRYKHDICLINRASYNICFGQGGQLCSSLLFGKCIFFDPIDENAFYRNNNLYNSGHRYFKRLEPMLQYLKEVLI